MPGSKRAFGLAAASTAVICAMATPTAAPIAADVIVSNIDAADIELTAPDASLLQTKAVALLAEPIGDEAPLASEPPLASTAPPLDLAALVESVSDMNDAELSDDMRCLASAIYHEARGETIEGQLAVAQVVLNRAASKRWPDSLCKVIFEPGQFSFTFDGRPDYPQASDANWKRAEAVAIIAATGNWQDVTDDALFFHATYVSPGWKHAKQQTRQIGRHVFYR